MFRCVARLRTQHPTIAWYAAFGDEPPELHHIMRNAQRYTSSHPIIIPWTLNEQPATTHEWLLRATVTDTLGSHPLLHDIVVQRANEAHYLRSPSAYHEHRARTIFVGDTHTVTPSIPHQQLADIVAQSDSYQDDVILQPVALSQNDPLIHAITHQTARGMPLERFGVGRAVEYDRRLLHIVDDMVRPYR
jgi:hypothetical protein